MSRELTIPVERIGAKDAGKMGYRTGFEGTVTLRRSDYGMKFMLDLLGDEVKLILSIEGVRR